MMFVVGHLSATFLKQAFFGDRLEVETIFLKIGGATVQLRQKVYRENTCIFLADIKLALVSEGRAIRLPKEVKEKLMDKEPSSDKNTI